MQIKAEETEKQRRLGVCNTCEHRHPVTDVCKKCWCYLPWKAGLKHSRCPLGKWGSQPINTITVN
jgi:hypothetical protein